MSKEKKTFVYVTYIRSTQEEFFEAITRPELHSASGVTRTFPIGSSNQSGGMCARTNIENTYLKMANALFIQK